MNTIIWFSRYQDIFLFQHQKQGIVAFHFVLILSISK